MKRFLKWRNPKTAPLDVHLIAFGRLDVRPKIRRLQSVRDRASLIGWLPLSALPDKPEIDLKTGEAAAGELAEQGE